MVVDLGCRFVWFGLTHYWILLLGLFRSIWFLLTGFFLVFGWVFWHYAESVKTWEQLEQLKQGMGNDRLERTKLETSCIYSQFSFVKSEDEISLFVCIFLWVFCEGWELGYFLASFWRLLRVITIIGIALLRLFINHCPPNFCCIYLFLIFFPIYM